MNFYQIRYGDPSRIDEPIPKNCKFTIGNSYKDLIHYKYLTLATAGTYPILKDKTGYLQQFEAVKKFDPNIQFGVTLDSNNHIVLMNNRTIPNVNLRQYVEGNTFIIPCSYNNSMPTRLFFNLNSSAVRQYLINMFLTKLPNIFIDNCTINDRQIFDGKQLLQYMSIGDEEQQCRIWAQHYANIINNIAKKNYVNIIVNGWRNLNSHVTWFYDELFKNTNSISAIMDENRWTNPDFYREYHNLETGISWYQKQIKDFDSRGIRVLFAGSNVDKDNDHWNCYFKWLSLITEKNCYLFANQNYQKEMLEYEYYKFDFGVPFYPAKLINNKWVRIFENGIIIWYLDYPALNLIRFYSRQTHSKLYNTYLEKVKQ